LVDQYGAVIDGYHRLEIGDELEMAVPHTVREFSDDEERREVALALKLKRRHLS